MDGNLSHADASIPVKKLLSHGEHSSQEAGPITERAMLQLSVFILKTVFMYVTFPLMSDAWPKAPVIFPSTHKYIAFSSCLQNQAPTVWVMGLIDPCVTGALLCPGTVLEVFPLSSRRGTLPRTRPRTFQHWGEGHVQSEGSPRP